MLIRETTEERLSRDQVIQLSGEVRNIRDPLERVDHLLNHIESQGSIDAVDPEIVELLLNNTRRVTAELRGYREGK